MNPIKIDASFKRQAQCIRFAVAVLTASGFVFSSVAPVQAIGFSIGANFADGNRSASGFIPPDTMGGVGPNNVAVMINGLYRVYSKAGIQQQSKSLNQFWIDAGQTPSGAFAFDPRILYDSASSRWFACAADNSGGANNFLVGVSAINNPAGAWTGFKIDADSDNLEWADYPTMGLNNSVLTISANMFPISSGSTTTTQLVIPKADLLLAAPTVANSTLFQNTDANEMWKRMFLCNTFPTSPTFLMLSSDAFSLGRRPSQ
jgi:hypothetical protein